MSKIIVKELRDVECPNCNEGKIDIGGEPPLDHIVDCDRCKGTGIIEVEIEHCKKCGEELEWNDMEFGFDEEKMIMFKCPNKCDAWSVN